MNDWPKASVAGFLLSLCTVGAFAAPALCKSITVSQDGGGDFKTIKEAVAAVPDDASERTTIHIKPGTYDEQQIVVPKTKRNVSWIGEDPKTTIITYDRNVNEPPADGSKEVANGTAVVIQGPDFRAENITFRNTSGDHGQAMAIRVQGDRAVFLNCEFLGWQDTVLAHSSRQYYRKCYIEGRVDFIYGGATAVFDECLIHSKNGGYVTAASTPENQTFGFVFLRCKLTGDEKPWEPTPGTAAATRPSGKPGKLAYLGRPWRPFAQVAFIECEMDDHIRPEGWHNWGKESNEQTARYREYKSTGPGGPLDKRVAWAKPLTDEEVQQYTVANILKGTDGWDPNSSK